MRGRADQAVYMILHFLFSIFAYGVKSVLYTRHTICPLVIDQNAREIAHIPVSFSA